MSKVLNSSQSNYMKFMQERDTVEYKIAEERSRSVWRWKEGNREICGQINRPV